MIFGTKKPDPPDAPLTWRTEQRRIGDLVEWEGNPRKLTEKEAKDLEASLRKFGYVEEIVLNADGKSIIGGHMRRKILLAQALLDPDAKVDVRLPSRALTAEESAELSIRLNRNTGGWDFDMLANGFDLDTLFDWGFTEADMGAYGIKESEHPDLPSGPKSDFEEMSFILHKSQAEIVRSSIGVAKERGKGESPINENAHGNALAAICGEWAARSN